ncbi:MAG TPA: YitT family protein, partial [Desulfovibrio sp.]|nr:YitT family protein [Desulfovibrio sp.]
MAKRFNLRDISDSLAWNIFLMLAGAFVFVVGYNGIAAHHDFVPGALYGFCVVLQKLVPQLTLSQWYLLLNVPMFTMALKGVSKRFFFLNMLTMGTVTLLTTYVQLDLGIHNEMYAAIASGAIMGAGCGMILRTYGGGGGLDVVAV